MNNDTDKHLHIANQPADFAQRLWDSGQGLLAAGRYVAARRELEAAERQAFRKRDAALLARIYLPLLEAARQIRQFCCDGIIAMTPANTQDHRAALREVFKVGGVWLDIQAAGMNHAPALSMPTDVPVESLRIVEQRQHWQITTHWRKNLHAPQPRPKGIAVLWTRDAEKFIAPAQPDTRVAILPMPGVYHPGNPRHAQARETLLLTFEALALNWLARHSESAGGWAELSILRQARKIDPACEPVLMRMMAVAQGLI
jgi:hypothetical protein